MALDLISISQAYGRTYNRADVASNRWFHAELRNVFFSYLLTGTTPPLVNGMANPHLPSVSGLRRSISGVIDSASSYVLAKGEDDPGSNWYYANSVLRNGFDSMMNPVDNTDFPTGTNNVALQALYSTTYRMPVAQFTQDYIDENIYIGLPTNSENEGGSHSPTYLQLRNLHIAYGQRNESITLQGVIAQEPRQIGELVGRTLQNSDYDKVPTKKELFNVSRGQWASVIDGPGGAVNPLNYTLFEFSDDERYRGFINNLNVTNLGGKPGIWEYKMNIVLVKNENPF